MSTSNISDAFEIYWRAYSSRREASSSTKPYWSAATLEKGIVPVALKALSVAITGQSYQTVKAKKFEPGIWVSRNLGMHDRVRINVVGFESQTSPIPYDEVADLAREGLCLCVLPRSDLRVWPFPDVPYAYSAGGALAVYPDDLDALGRGDWNLLEMMEYKLHRRLSLDKPDPETQFDPHILREFRHVSGEGNGWSPRSFDEVIEQSGEDIQSWIEHPLVDRAKRILDSGRNCLLTGPSSCGKSILAFQCATQMASGGRGVSYVNLGTQSNFSSGWFRALVEASGSRSKLFVVDDLQSNPAAARYLLAISSTVRRALIDEPPIILAIAWPDFASAIVGWMEDCVPLAVRPHQVAPGILRAYGSGLRREAVEGLSANFGADLLVLRKSLERAKKTGSQPDIHDVAKDIWESRTVSLAGPRDVPERVALVAGSLGRFDIFTPQHFLKKEAGIELRDLTSLERARVIRKIGESYTLGHRSLCSLVVSWLSRQGSWKNLVQRGGPGSVVAVVLDYLRSDTSALALDTLRSLQAKAGFKEASQLNSRAATVLEVWRALESVAERIEHQQTLDPTWTRTPSSVMFAIQALCDIGKKKVAEPSLEFLSRLWRTVGSVLEINTSDVSTRQDFERIRERMLKEDRMLEEATSPLPWDRTEAIDVERFHKTWLAGVILCSEAAFLGNPQRLETLAQAIESMSLPNGAFYPPRVPWSTARVLMGLAGCGRTVDTSACVERATDWLMNERTGGGACDNGIWHSGTGTWNSDLETTAMVLLALSMVGIDCNDGRFDKARAYLASQRSRWIAPSNELDGALCLQAYLAIGGNWEDVIEEAQHLSKWALSESLWRSTPASAEQLFKQSCSVAQIACHLVSIGWSAIRSDLRVFLDTLAVTENVGQPPIAVNTTESEQGVRLPAIIREVDSSDPVIECLGALSSVSLGDSTVVGRYRRNDERVRNQLKDWSARISEPLREKSQVRENFLLWAAPGSGKSFFVQEIARSMNDEIEFVEINVARRTRGEILDLLERLSQSVMPTLCLIDEIDVRADEAWPYEDIFPHLDLNLSTQRRNVFAIIGSMSTGIGGLTRHISGRHKGKDLLDRIPVDRRFEIPPLSIGDRMVIVAGALLDASRSRNQAVTHIEKCVLYFVLMNEELRSPRQLRDFATDVVQRMPVDETWVRYEHMSCHGDRRTYEFWARNQPITRDFSDRYVQIDGPGIISHNETQQD